jgi:DNA-binding NarL/FixJ family response regulator
MLDAWNDLSAAVRVRLDAAEGMGEVNAALRPPATVRRRGRAAGQRSRLSTDFGALRTTRRSRAPAAAAPPPRPARGVTDGPLTGREREIADLVAAGHTNREIAE